MKKYLLYALLFAGVGTSMTSCSEDDLSKTSVITVDKQEENEFDKWLNLNFVSSYNMNFAYRYEDKEVDMNYYHVPADMKASIEMAHLLKYLCLEAYDEMAGVNFTRAYFPKMIYLDGEFEWRNNGTMILGTAEGGKKILLTGINYLDANLDDIDVLNKYYFKTIHHEFTHILNQTKDYSAAFQLITGSGYVSDSWSNETYKKGYLQRGFITDYSQHSHGEDFAEMVSVYVTNTPAQWKAWMEEAGDDGRAAIEAKLEIVKDYMQSSWNINLDDLRSTILRRQNDISAGKVDLTDISVK